ncbi:MAG: prolyl oligopeptidase family serine peptidase [Candidatus Longimicrobiales bacterium M2_2A_002]
MRRALSFALLLAAALVVPRAALAQQGDTAAIDDPYLWLEQVEGERAMQWVTEQSEATLETLREHPVFEPVFEETLEILNSDDRIAYPSIIGDRLYNFWQDADHERGIWRRTSWAAYLAGAPDWETVLDIDALAAAEDVPWSFAGASCLAPENRRCMVRLSRGGSDAVELREFDLEAAEFVEGGFRLPEAKSSVAWAGPDALLVGTDFGEGSLTTSGYARIVKRWERGTDLADATTVFEAERDHMGVFVGSLETPDTVYQVIMHRPSFFDGTVYVVAGTELTALDVPTDSDPTLFGDQLVVYLRSPWEVGDTTYAQGSIIAMDYDRFLAGARDFDVVVAPGPRRTVQQPVTTRSHLLVTILDNVREQLWRFRRVDGDWVGERVETRDFGSIGIAAADVHSDRFFFTYASFTQPTTLYLAEEDGGIREVRRSPEWFDADGLVVEQHWATSADGTEIPYFVVHAEGMARDGGNPTLLTAYGGFQISRTPFYSGTVGRAWLERGGVYVLANIRGGGEFGPAWWRAALKENRQRAYDDFLAVAEDLIERGVTSPDHLGIQGGSNGGLLVGVAMTQRPDLFDAVVAAVPLLDMRRYNKLLAGASWMAEYGNPDKPEEWAYIREYSPYHNVSADVDYPRPLFYTTTRDDRVHPGHARKMAKKMMDMGHGVFYWENTEGGHGSGVTPEQRARQTAITYAYLWKQLGS